MTDEVISTALINGDADNPLKATIEETSDIDVNALVTKDINIEKVSSINNYTNTYEIRVFQENHICLDNTTSTNLLANQTFIGDWQDCLQYQEVNISVSSDKNSAIDGLIIEWSDDANNICDTDKFTVYANAGTNYTPNPAFRYIRVKYINGTEAQTNFHLMTILRRGVTGGSFHRITDTLKDDSDGRLNLSVLKLRTAANNYVSGAATNAGNFKISIEELEAIISDNEKSQLKTSMYSKTSDTTWQQPIIDATTHTLQTIDYEHHEIHSGSSFTTDYCVDVANGANADVLLTTPNTTKWAHMTYEVEGELEFDFNLYEAPTTTGGTALNIYNRDRNNITNSTVTAVHTPTVTNVGTRIRCHHSGSGRSFGGANRGTYEFILKQNTKYLLRFTNATVNNNRCSLKIDWYEHTNKTA